MVDRSKDYYKVTEVIPGSGPLPGRSILLKAYNSVAARLRRYLMNTSTRASARIVLLTCFLIFLSSIILAQEKSASEWREAKLPFRALNTTSLGDSLWVCGTAEGIAVSSDGGEHFEVKHQKPDGAVLLNVAFADDKFGYAAGAAGALFMTEDGGQTWSPHPAGQDAILQISFADPKRGLIRTSSSLLFTIDGGATWAVVSPGENVDEAKKFLFPFSLVALDATHMGVMLKQGTAQYMTQAFLFTQDAGKSWTFLNIPNVTLYSFLRLHGKYWAVGTEVIHKSDPGGGYGVPVALFSSDGAKWERSDNDLSACRPQMCTACNTSGCFSANGTITDLFSAKTAYREFPTNKKLTATWAAAGSAVCFVGAGLECAGTKSVQSPNTSEGPLPTAVAPGPLGPSAEKGPRCLVCAFDRIFIDSKAEGTYAVKLSLEIGRDGAVSTASAEGAPTPEIESRIDNRLKAGS